jgi:hypothetical protein
LASRLVGEPAKMVEDLVVQLKVRAFGFHIPTKDVDRDVRAKSWMTKVIPSTYTQTYPDIHRHTQTYTDIHRHTQTYTTRVYTVPTQPGQASRSPQLTHLANPMGKSVSIF